MLLAEPAMPPVKGTSAAVRDAALSHVAVHVDGS